MAAILAVCEQRDGTLKRVALETVSAARTLADALGGEVHALVMGPEGVDVSALGPHGADRVLVAAEADLGLYQPGAWASIAADRAGGDYAAVLLAATALGRDLGPRLAARLGAPLAADVTALDGDGGSITVTRPLYAGKALARLKVTAPKVVITLRPNNFTPTESGKAGTVESVALPAITSHGERTREVKASERGALDVAEAPIVVSGGRGLREPEQFKLIEDLAAAFGSAAVGASRAVVDAGWRPHSEQVGQTGKTVSPNLYVAVGISGAIQHLAGMRTARTIVAINKDKDAPIFKVADYGIVGDLFEIVPRLTEAVRAARSA